MVSMKPLRQRWALLDSETLNNDVADRTWGCVLETTPAELNDIMQHCLKTTTFDGP
jgi:hypothetical protein